MKKISEFGRGLTVNLVKFAEHFFFYRDKLSVIRTWLEKTSEERVAMLTPFPPPELNYGEGFKRELDFFVNHTVPIFGGVDKAVSHEIEMWANGASDHLYDIKIPDCLKGTKIAKKIKRLQEKGLRIGHSFSEVVWTFKDLDELENLTIEIALDIDRKVFKIKDADIGQI